MKEYGRKPYIAKTYKDMMTKTPNKAMWDQVLEKHSEFEKPYQHKAGEYQAMQYYYPNLPGLSGDDRFDHPWMGQPVTSPYHVIWYCGLTPCYCEGTERCTTVECTYPVIGVDIESPSRCSGVDIKVDGNKICITTGENPTVACRIRITMRTPSGLQQGYRVFLGYKYSTGAIPGGLVGTFPGGGIGGVKIPECDDCCITDGGMAWDYDTSSATIVREASEPVAITGNNTPFTWAVSGVGFTLDNVETVGLGNVLNADDTACGSATITVTGCDATEAIGQVRCTTGQWSAFTNGCVLSGAPDTIYYSGGCQLEKTEGKYFQNQVLIAENALGCENCPERDRTECLDWTCVLLHPTGCDAGDTDCGNWCCRASASTSQCADNGGDVQTCMYNSAPPRYKEWIC